MGAQYPRLAGHPGRFGPLVPVWRDDCPITPTCLAVYRQGVVIVPRLLDVPLQEHDSPLTLIVGPQPLFLAALAQLLSSPPLNLRVELSTRSDEAIARIRNQEFQLVFCDLWADPTPGAELAATVTGPGRATRVVLLADPEDRGSLVTSLECGAVGFFTKDSSPEDFLDGVRAVLAGHFTLGRNLVQPTLARFARHEQTDASSSISRLSPTEKRVLSMVASAQPVRSIAAAYGIAPKTVRNHLASIYRKLGLRNRSEAVLWSARMGLTEPPFSH